MTGGQEEISKEHSGATGFFWSKLILQGGLWVAQPDGRVFDALLMCSWCYGYISLIWLWLQEGKQSLLPFLLQEALHSPKGQSVVVCHFNNNQQGNLGLALRKLLRIKHLKIIIRDQFEYVLVILHIQYLSISIQVVNHNVCTKEAAVPGKSQPNIAIRAHGSMCRQQNLGAIERR